MDKKLIRWRWDEVGRRLRLRHWGLTVPQVVVLSYLATAAMGGIGLALLAVRQETALVLIGLTVGGLAFATLVLKRVDMSAPGRSLLHEMPAPTNALERGSGDSRS